MVVNVKTKLQIMTQIPSDATDATGQRIPKRNVFSFISDSLRYKLAIVVAKNEWNCRVRSVASQFQHKIEIFMIVLCDVYRREKKEGFNTNWQALQSELRECRAGKSSSRQFG